MRKGSAVLEYSLLVVIVISAFYGLATFKGTRSYFIRAMGGMWRQVGDTFGFGRQYEEGVTIADGDGPVTPGCAYFGESCEGGVQCCNEGQGIMCNWMYAPRGNAKCVYCIRTGYPCRSDPQGRQCCSGRGRCPERGPNACR